MFRRFEKTKDNEEIETTSLDDSENRAGIPFRSVQMNNGTVFRGEKKGELVQEIIDKFSREKLTHDEAIEVLEGVKDVLGEFSLVQNVKDFSATFLGECKK